MQVCGFFMFSKWKMFSHKIYGHFLLCKELCKPFLFFFPQWWRTKGRIWEQPRIIKLLMCMFLHTVSMTHSIILPEHNIAAMEECIKQFPESARVVA